MITCAAIKDIYGNVWDLPQPARHSDIIHWMSKYGAKSNIDGQGFMIDDQVFVGRKTAAAHAIECGQIKELKWPPDLYSEDLW